MNCDNCKVTYNDESKFCKKCGSVLEKPVVIVDESKVIASKISALVVNRHNTILLGGLVLPSHITFEICDTNTLIINYPFTSLPPMIGGSQIKTMIFPLIGTDSWYSKCDLSNYANIETVYMCYDGMENHVSQYVDDIGSINYFVGLKSQEEITGVVIGQRPAECDYIEPVIKSYLYVMKHLKGIILVSTEIKNNYGKKRKGNRKIMKIDTYNETKDVNIISKSVYSDILRKL